jgi:hypothetical protein
MACKYNLYSKTGRSYNRAPIRVEENHEVVKTTRREMIPIKKCIMNVDIELENNFKQV